MTALAHGDTKAFDHLYERYSNRLLYYFFRMLGQNEAKAQDFLQEVFLKIIEKPELYRRGARFSTWIFSIAHNMCKNEYRRLEVRKKVHKKRFVEAVTPAEESSAYFEMEKYVDEGAFRQALLTELEELDREKRSLFLLRFQERFSIRQISKVLDCAEGTVKSRLFYLTKNLAKKLQAYKIIIHESDHV